MRQLITFCALGCLLLLSTTSAAPPLPEQEAIRDIYNAIPGLSLNADWFKPDNPEENMCTSWRYLSCKNDSITQIEFTFGQWTGFLPNSIANLTNLEKFVIDGNFLTGTIPVGMVNLPLRVFRIDGNLFYSPFPAQLVNISTLQELSLQKTQFREPWPNAWSSSLTYVDLNQVAFTGPLPPSMASMTNLRSLFIIRNAPTFNGSVPHFLFTMSSLEQLDISENSLRDALPDLCGLPSLRGFNIDFNSFTNYTMPDLSCLQNLTEFKSRASGLSGTFPSGVALTSLTTLNIDGNKLTGPIPEEASLRPWINLLLGYNKYVRAGRSLLRGLVV